MKAAFQQLKKIPRSIWALGFVSMFMDISSEMVHGLLPAYLVTVLGASMLTVGAIEGMAEATASFFKLFSGLLSDYLGKRKLLVALGYGLAACSKFLFPFANSVSAIVVARFIDRVGKGVREAPRDALIADITPSALWGASYGLRQALDTVGAVVGPLIAVIAMLLFAQSFRAVFWIAVIPAFIALAIMVLGVQEPVVQGVNQAPRIKWADIRLLGINYWYLIGVSIIATFARFSDIFLVMRAQYAGVHLAWIPAVIVIMNIVYSLSVYPIGYFSDSTNRARLLALGFVVLCISQAVLAYATTMPGILLGVVLWGLQMGMTQGLFSAMVADSVPAALRGTAFGIFNGALGVTLLLSNSGAGLLWDWYGPEGTFAFGAGCAVIALVAMLARSRFYVRVQS